MPENYKVVAAAIPVTFSDGTEVKVAPLTDKDIEELNEWVRAEYIKMVRASIPAELSAANREVELRVAFDQAAGIQWMSGTGAKMMASANGMARLMYQGCLKHQPQISFVALRALMFLPANVDKTRLAFERLNSSQKKGPRKKTTPKRTTKRKSTGA